MPGPISLHLQKNLYNFTFSGYHGKNPHYRLFARLY